MTLPLPRSYAPMEALLVDELPTGDEWQYEPKWDGTRMSSRPTGWARRCGQLK